MKDRHSNGIMRITNRKTLQSLWAYTAILRQPCLQPLLMVWLSHGSVDHLLKGTKDAPE
jgi:hypothetical protein